jgi:hypothetical protein
MKVIFSYVDFSLKEKNHSKILKMAAVSNFLAQKHGYETILFVDKKSRLYFENIQYNNIFCLEEQITENIPKSIWSLGKLLAMSQMKEPFIHIDFDILLLRQLKDDLIKKEFLCLHGEEWLLFNTKILVDIYKNLNTYIAKPISLNCAIVGGNNFELINQIAIELVNYALNNKVLLEDINEKLPQKDKCWMLPVIFEQILFTNLIFNNLKINYKDNLIIKTPKYEDISSELIKNGIVHLWANKDKQVNLNLIENILKNNNIKY